ncbi:hypothetical protein Tco_1284025 [Tanacetum coccineum]
MTPESVQTMNDQDLQRNSTNGDGSHSSHRNNRRNVQTVRPCFYADFMKCQPLNFKGTEGLGEYSFRGACEKSATVLLTRVFWGADEELSDGGPPRVIVYRYNGLPMQSVAPPSPDYIPGPKEPQTPPVPQDEDELGPMINNHMHPDYVPKHYVP